VSLVPEGRAEAEALGRWLVPAIRHATPVLTSPLTRAVETCQLAGFGATARVEPDLVEWDYGAYEGRTTEEIRAERPGWTLWTDGVPDGETAADVGRRADRVIERLRAGSGDAICFAHGHLLRALAARWVGLPPAGGRVLALDAGSVSVLGWEREVPVVLRWNQRPAVR
jgi:broad specificity phosphatase PhoE